jgi:hypothetical protein
VRFSDGRRWIACLTAFPGRRRTPMTPRRYTELFFLDEATALAAGHRPCWECRRADCASGPGAGAIGQDEETALGAPGGYAAARPLPREPAEVLTLPSIVDAIAAGDRAGLHLSAPSPGT